MQRTGAVRRGVWTAGGVVAVAIGAVGIVVPGLPTTVFFIVAAWCFSHSSPRLEQRILDLPGIGRLVRDHRDGLGMPRRAKVIAVTTIIAAAGASALLAVDSRTVRLVVAAAAAAGIAWITWRVPTHERVLADRVAGGAVR